MLTRLSSTSARITEVGDVAERLAVLFKKQEKLHEDKFLVATMDEIATLGEKITLATRRDSVLSKLEELDLIRDNALRILGKLASAYEVIPVDDIRVHGEKLAAIFGKYGVKTTQASYSEESNLIGSLLKDLSAKSMAAGIAKMPGVRQAIDMIGEPKQNLPKSEPTTNTRKTCRRHRQMPPRSESRSLHSSTADCSPTSTQCV